MKSERSQWSFRRLGASKLVHVEKLTDINADLYKAIQKPKSGIYTLQMVLKGSGTLYHNYQQYTIKPGQLLITLPETVLWMEPTEGTEFELIVAAFTSDFFDWLGVDRATLEFGFGLGSDLDKPMAKAERKFCIDLLTLILDEYLAFQNKMQDLMLPKLIDALLYYAIRHKSNNVLENDKNQSLQNIFKSFATAVESNFMRWHNITDYEKILNMESDKLQKACQKMVKQNAADLIDQRIDFEIKSLLIHTEQTVDEIGYTLGFGSEQATVHFFKERNKTTPDKYRAEVLKQLGV